MVKNLQTLFFIFLIAPDLLYAQVDSVSVEAKKLGIFDIIKPVEEDKGKIKIISGSRFPLAAGEQPFSVHVITKEEIRENAYETLVDVLKMTPGNFTSQPGSAVEGETFLMRGLLGNSYTKILVNDIPIKPSFLASMPIGSQLPVREAERIEIIYGAGASLYGADASAGVINIITRQSDKPVYMQADLAVGNGQYSSANVMFGGKWGKDKNILHYFAYGSNVIYDNRKISRDYDTNFNINNYPRLSPINSVFYDSPPPPNFRVSQEGLPSVNNLPHLSRKFGVNLKFRRLSLSLEAMTRRDHSSLGLNPVAVTYSNPLTYTGETVYRANLNLYKEKKNHNRKTDFTFIRYRLDDNASIAYVQNTLARGLFNLARVEANKIDINNPGPHQSVIYNRLYDKYLDGTRYMYAVSDEYRLEYVRNHRLFKTSTLTVGGNAKLTNGVPATSFLLQPPDDDQSVVFIDENYQFINDTLVFPVRPSYWQTGETNLFSQLFYSNKRFNIAVGFNYSSVVISSPNDVFIDDVFLPRIAGLLKITEDLNIRSSWGRAYRAPNVFYNSNSYLISSDRQREVSILTDTRLQPETSSSWESGVRLLSGKSIDFDFTYFIHETKDLINYGRQPIIGENGDLNYNVIFGYLNTEDSNIKFRGGQFTTSVLAGKKTNGKYMYSWTKSQLDKQGSTENDFLPEYTARMHQFRITYRPFKTTTLILDYRRIKRTLLEDIDNEGDVKFATIDFVGRYAFTDHLNIYVKVTNLTNKRFSGINATRTPDDLIFNTQYAGFTKIGMNYFID